jgi:hypothetical protein
MLRQFSISKPNWKFLKFESKNSKAKIRKQKFESKNSKEKIRKKKFATKNSKVKIRTKILKIRKFYIVQQDLETIN